MKGKVKMALKILVVDDHPVVRRGLISALSEVPEFQVVGEAANASDAVARAGELKPDVVLMDIFMSGIDGIEATAILHRMFPDIKVLILSVSENEKDLSRALEAGARGYLLKGAGLTELIDTVRMVSSGNIVFSALISMKLLQGFREVAKNGNISQVNLSSQEKKVLRLAAEGASNKEIASQLYIGETTVKAHFRNILEKLHAKNRAGAVAVGMTNGLFEEANPPK
jgi:DNA-binding NarL/FixJ family response regulator